MNISEKTVFLPIWRIKEMIEYLKNNDQDLIGEDVVLLINRSINFSQEYLEYDLDSNIDKQIDEYNVMVNKFIENRELSKIENNKFLNKVMTLVNRFLSIEEEIDEWHSENGGDDDF